MLGLEKGRKEAVIKVFTQADLYSADILQLLFAWLKPLWACVAMSWSHSEVKELAVVGTTRYVEKCDVVHSIS